MIRPDYPPPATDVDHPHPDCLRFWDSPGIAKLYQAPIKRCETCHGSGAMAGLECPDCKGLGGLPGHATNASLVIVDLVIGLAKQQAMLDLLRKETPTDGPPPAMVHLDMQAYLTEHSACYLKAVVLALRLLIHKWVPADVEDPVVMHLARMLQGDFTDGEFG